MMIMKYSIESLLKLYQLHCLHDFFHISGTILMIKFTNCKHPNYPQYYERIREFNQVA